MQKVLVNPENMVTPLSKYSHGVKVQMGQGSLIFVTGQIPIDPQGKLVGEGDARKQTEYVFGEIAAILSAAGASLEDVAKATIFVTDMDEFPQVAEVRNHYFAQSPPASTFVEVNKMVRQGVKVEIEVVAGVGDGGWQKVLVNPENMVTPLSKYSHGVKVQMGQGSLIFVTGQIPIDPQGKLVGEGDARKQTEYVFGEIAAILSAAGASLEDVAKATIFVTDMDEFPQVAEVRNHYFAQSPPASTFVEVNKMVRQGVKLEIEVVAASENVDLASSFAQVRQVAGSSM